MGCDRTTPSVVHRVGGLCTVGDYPEGVSSGLDNG